MHDLIQVRVTRDEKRRLVDHARKRGVTLSEFVRSTSMEAAERASA